MTEQDKTLHPVGALDTKRATLAMLALTALLLSATPMVGIGKARAQGGIAPDALDLSVKLLADGFATPLWGTHAPGSPDQIYVVDQVGKITALPTSTSTSVPAKVDFLDVGSDGLDLIVALPFSASVTERGLLGLAFDRDYQLNGLLYTYTSEPTGPASDFSTVGGAGANHLSVIREWRVDNPTNPASVVNPESSRVLLRIEQPQGNHNGGALEVGPDGLLYVALGDGGGRDDEGAGHPSGGNGQNLSETNLWGKILRIDPQGTTGVNGEYGIPPDNPFVARAGPDEAWAIGFRNPFRIGFDPVTGDLYVGDVGQHDIEEVDIVTAGGNYGWPIKEGTFLFDGNGAANGSAGANSPGIPADLIDPVTQYDHGQGISVTGGFVYRGSELPSLNGSYVFGDFTRSFGGPAGRLFAWDEAGGLRELLPTNQADFPLYITGFGQDAAGEIYLMGIQRAETAGTSGLVLKLTAQGPTMCQGQAITIDMNTNGGNGAGTPGNDVIAGTPGDDVITASDGDDVICAGEGNDDVRGGPGDDVIAGGGGDDRLVGAQGNDVITGGDGNDTIHGNMGEDDLRGELGDDRIFGYAGHDLIDGGPGRDRLHGNFGNDVMRGGPGDDAMFGYGDRDDMSGGQGNDLMVGNRGNDVIAGNFGNDVLYGSDGDDLVDGGAGDDQVNGNSLNDTLLAGPGNDTLDGGIDTDSCDGGLGTDTASRCETTTGVP